MEEAGINHENVTIHVQDRRNIGHKGSVLMLNPLSVKMTVEKSGGKDTLEVA